MNKIKPKKKKRKKRKTTLTPKGRTLPFRRLTCDHTRCQGNRLVWEFWEAANEKTDLCNVKQPNMCEVYQVPQKNCSRGRDSESKKEVRHMLKSKTLSTLVRTKPLSRTLKLCSLTAIRCSKTGRPRLASESDMSHPSCLDTSSRWLNTKDAQQKQKACHALHP